jgi:hypothetical protein
VDDWQAIILFPQRDHVDTGVLAALAKPTIVGQRRMPGVKPHDDRVIRLLETLLHPGALATDWTTRELLARVLARNRLADSDYRLSQLRYDLAKPRAKGLVQRVGRTRRYRLTPQRARLGALIVKLRTRLLGPIASLATQARVARQALHHNPVDAAFHHVDSALDQLCAALGLQPAAVNRIS